MTIFSISLLGFDFEFFGIFSSFYLSIFSNPYLLHSKSNNPNSNINLTIFITSNVNSLNQPLSGLKPS